MLKGGGVRGAFLVTTALTEMVYLLKFAEFPEGLNENIVLVLAHKEDMINVLGTRLKSYYGG